MPRVRQGGDRSGTPGQGYTNRTDLQVQPSLPARAATDQTYGKAQQQLQAQRTVPMAPPVLNLPQASGGPPVAPSPGGPPSTPTTPIPPGAFGDLHRPTERPGEPVTAGSPLGAGPGPEAIPAGPANPDMNSNLSALLGSLAQSSGSAALTALAQHAQAAGQ